MTVTTFVLIVIALALAVALGPYMQRLLRWLVDVAWFIFAIGGALTGVGLLLFAITWHRKGDEIGVFSMAAGFSALGLSLGAFKLRRWYSHRCPICKQTLFRGEADPLDYYVPGHGGRGSVPLVVCVSGWSRAWRRQWYHQTCCDVYFDKTDREGHWYIFGSALLLKQQQEGGAQHRS